MAMLRLRAKWRWLGLLGAAGLILALATCGGTGSNAPGAASAANATQRSEGGQVTIAATWEGMAAGPVFAIVMDTHAVNLDGYDLRLLATLRTDRGATVAASSWEAPSGGHHRAGTLTFPAAGPDGQPLITAETRALELTIRDVAGVPERILRWTP